jgi:hypothetical protein
VGHTEIVKDDGYPQPAALSEDDVLYDVLGEMIIFFQACGTFSSFNFAVHEGNCVFMHDSCNLAADALKYAQRRHNLC